MKLNPEAVNGAAFAAFLSRRNNRTPFTPQTPGAIGFRALTEDRERPGSRQSFYALSADAAQQKNREADAPAIGETTHTIEQDGQAPLTTNARGEAIAPHIEAEAAIPKECPTRQGYRTRPEDREVPTGYTHTIVPSFQNLDILRQGYRIASPEQIVIRGRRNQSHKNESGRTTHMPPMDHTTMRGATSQQKKKYA